MVSKKIESVELQDRDLDVLRGLFESRVMTSGHIANLYFEGKTEYAKKRLQKIKAAGFINERGRHVTEPAILFLTRKGFLHLRSGGHLSQYPKLSENSFEARANVSEITLRHELEIMDVKSALSAALRQSERFELLEFGTWPVLHEFRTTPLSANGKEIAVRPDGFIRIHEKEPGTKGFLYDCFLEVDRSTEIQSTLLTKAECYLEYYRSGGFAERSGASRSDYREYPFRVLMVMKSEERRNNTALKLLERHPPILTQVWLTTLAAVTADPLGPIWVQPRQYREITDAVSRPANQAGARLQYRRNIERDAFIESEIMKLPLLEMEAIPGSMPCMIAPAAA